MRTSKKVHETNKKLHLGIFNLSWGFKEVLLVCILVKHVLYSSILFFYFQVKLSEKECLLETAEAKIAEFMVMINEQQKLIQKLEDDISKVWFEPPLKMTA